MASVVNNSSGGQSHNRIADDADMSMAHMMDTHGSGSDASLDITLGQKMMSAVAGSLMTSVLGKSRRSLTTLSCVVQY